MLKSFRRNSKQLFEPRRKSVATESSKTSKSSQDLLTPTLTHRQTRTTFFDLPAELRNVVYEDIATHTSLQHNPSPRKSRQEPPNIPSLLLVSKQARQEFMPIVLSLAPIRVTVQAFDFRDLIRVKASLYSTELKALRANTNLTVQLLAEKPDKYSIAVLRRWLVNRSEGLDRLGWHYAVIWPRALQISPFFSEVKSIDALVQRRVVLNQTLRALEGLSAVVDETLQFELLPIQEVFQAEMAGMGMQVDWGTSDALGAMRMR